MVHGRDLQKRKSEGGDEILVIISMNVPRAHRTVHRGGRSVR